ncbi:hypothetical protein CGCF413_v006506 [Colletotrichum fructicola]|nr:hypothetical protein CGCF413_v006506 [Colletotrichum fructicola]
MPLCGTCEGFDLASLLDQDRDVHDLVFHNSISKLKDNALTCDFCRLLWTTLTKDQAEDSDFFFSPAKDDDHESPVVLRGITTYIDDDYEAGGIYCCQLSSILTCCENGLKNAISITQAVGPILESCQHG